MSVYSVTQHSYDAIDEMKWTEEKKKYFQYLYTKIKDDIHLKKGKLLDVGCGLGTWAAYVKEKTGCAIYGMEMSSESVKIAKKNGLSMKLSDIEQRWPYKNETFQVVSAIQLIEHILNPDFFITESHRVLQKNGYLIITTPNMASWFNRIIFLFGYQPLTNEVSTVDKTFGLKFTRYLTKNRSPVGHIRSFTLKALSDMLEHYDFTIVKKLGGKVDYLPKFMQPFDQLLSNIPGISSDIILIAQKK